MNAIHHVTTDSVTTDSVSALLRLLADVLIALDLPVMTDGLGRFMGLL